MLATLRERGYDLEPDALADEGQLRPLRLEYTRVFIGPGPHASPYGSVYHPDDEKSGELWGKTTQQVHRFAADHGLTFVGKAYDGIPDHIAHELELYAKLLEARAVALYDGEDDKAERVENSQRYLYREQLNRWVPAFATRVSEFASRPLYAELARLTKDLLDEEGDRLGEREVA